MFMLAWVTLLASVLLGAGPAQSADVPAERRAELGNPR